MRLFLQILSVSDRYERKARLLPGLLLAACPALTAGAVLQPFAAWYATAGTAIGVEFLSALVLGQLARARGQRLEEALWKALGGGPAIRWLRPWDHSCSDQQKVKWRGAIKRLTGLTLPASVPDGGSEGEVDRLNADAIRQLRYALRAKPEATMLAIHNEEYGFARNLTAVRWYWVALSLTCLAGCGAGFAFGIRPYVGLAIAGTFSVVSILISRELPEYVMRCADRYTESLFATAIIVSQAKHASAKKTKRKSAKNGS